MNTSTNSGVTRSLFRLLLALAAFCLTGPDEARAADREKLWRVVNDICGPMQKFVGLPAPCLKVDRERGFAVLRAPSDITRILVVPTRKIEGVESPVLLRPDTPNIWSYAWNSRGKVSAAASRPLSWADIGMAVNSSRARTQDQLHIHVDCVDARLKRALRAHPPRSDGWTPIDLPWAYRYRAKRIGAKDLDRNIFKMVADETPSAKGRTGRETLAVVGYEAPSGEEGFVVLASGDDGHAEKLLDHRCLEDRR
ncbi:CDP-diacylglycerol diphosphatase [uncultured Rhodoblastus sp.]|uniref:CDP-diacylglycerol diphosphatase n=1 Tax=uncultured Rhodoblastus sp. TaxID=543037 RepID=UPI0025E9346F|nr:CDP-diacylglycerol diphosphatase [uncultured Rhodoblastus sp.]